MKLKFLVINFLAIVAIFCFHVAGALDEFEQQCLAEHNRLRSFHGSPPLEYSAEISQYSLNWARSLLDRNAFGHSGGSYGENIFAGGGSAWTATDVLNSWYGERKDYHTDNGEPTPDSRSKTLHFTQVVWRSSTSLGIGRVTNGERTVVVCNYDPPGNYGGQYHDNVYN